MLATKVLIGGVEVKRRIMAVLVQSIALLLLAASCPIGNVKPLAIFTASPISGYSPLVVECDAAGSCDSGGSIISYAWSFGDGGIADGVTSSNTYSNAGTYTIQLTVTDDDGSTDSVSQIIEVIVPPAFNRSPDASFSAWPTSGQAPLSVDFDASNSSDGDGAITLYAWDFGDGRTASGINVVHTYNTAGVYTAYLAVTDDHGAIGTGTRTIQVSGSTSPPNALPVASFTVLPRSGEAPLLVNFDASGSSDADGIIRSYAWSFGDGQTASGISASHTYNTAGGYTAQLIVTDDDGVTQGASRTIQVSGVALLSNIPPAASFAVSTEVGAVPLVVDFDASDSSDADGTIIAYEWSFGDGRIGTGVRASHTYNSVGTYTALLTVRDDDGATHKATQKISVLSVPNSAPVANFTASPLTGQAALAVSFDASGSSDSDGTITSYVWDFGDGRVATGVTANRTYNTEGTYRVQLTITDDDGATDLFSRTIQVLGPSVPNSPPIANFTILPTSGKAPLAVSCDASGSADADGTITSYIWNFGDGAGSSGVTASNTYNNPGTYVVQLVVTDDDGATESASRTVTALPNSEPVASFVAAPASGQAALAVTFDASGSLDSDGAITSYVWDFGDGRTATGVTARLMYKTEGIYTVQLTITDDEGAIDLCSQTIQVFGPSVPNVPPIASFQSSPTSGPAPLAVRCDASGALDPDGTITSYVWSFGDGGRGTGIAPRHTYNRAGTYTIQLSVIDDDGDEQVATRSVQVSGEPVPNISPTANFLVSPTTGVAPLVVSFNASDSSDPDGTITSYGWSFGDGSTATGVFVSHTYSSAGTYTFRLTVTDNDRGSNTVTRTIQVSPAVGP